MLSVKQSNFVRKSLFFQVHGAPEASEPLLVNPEYIYPNLNDRKNAILGLVGHQGEIFRYLVNSMPLSMRGEIIRRLRRKPAR
jgi:hypothetical protein